jgi:hypothetical protein
MTYQNDLEEHFLVHLHEFLVPFINISGLLAGVRVIILGGGWVVLVVLAPLENLLHHGLVDLRAVSDMRETWRGRAGLCWAGLGVSKDVRSG